MEDQLTLAALRMLVKDLLILFQAVNEGVINVLGEDRGQASQERLLMILHLTQSTILRCRMLMPKRPLLSIDTFANRRNTQLSSLVYQRNFEMSSMYPSRI